LRASSPDLLAGLVELFLHLRRRRGVQQGQGRESQTGPGIGFGAVVPAQFLQRFSIFSATWSCISCAVAPGQAVMTVITLTVKAGSSARPSLKKETSPASEISR
jgi:hypothetical protein